MYWEVSVKYLKKILNDEIFETEGVLKTLKFGWSRPKKLTCLLVSVEKRDIFMHLHICQYVSVLVSQISGSAESVSQLFQLDTDQSLCQQVAKIDSVVLPLSQFNRKLYLLVAYKKCTSYLILFAICCLDFQKPSRLHLRMRDCTCLYASSYP